MSAKTTTDYDRTMTVRAFQTRPDTDDFALTDLSQEVAHVLDGLDCSQDWGFLLTAQEEGEYTEIWASEYTVAHNDRYVECILAPTDPATQGCRCCHPAE